MPDSAWRSSRERVVSVRPIRSLASRREMRPRSRATSADHRYPPMFVGDVYRERLAGDRSPPMLSATSAVSLYSIASMDFHVSTAYCFKTFGGEALAIP